MATSVEKVHQLLAEVKNAPSASGKMAIAQLLLGQALPMAASSLPEDPEELDVLLSKVAKFVLSLRTDGYEEPEGLEGPNLAGLFSRVSEPVDAGLEPVDAGLEPGTERLAPETAQLAPDTPPNCICGHAAYEHRTHDQDPTDATPFPCITESCPCADYDPPGRVR